MKMETSTTYPNDTTVCHVCIWVRHMNVSLHKFLSNGLTSVPLPSVVELSYSLHSASYGDIGNQVYLSVLDTTVAPVSVMTWNQYLKQGI